MRRLLVVSPRPHPWVMLRDRLDPAMVHVDWHRPDRRWDEGAVWAVAGEGRDAGTGDPGWPSLRWWVGEQPPGVPEARQAEGWRQVVEAVGRCLTADVAGVRLAPTCGLALADGGYVTGTTEIETLLAAGPEGLPCEEPDAAPALRRLRAALRRHRLPLELVVEGGVGRLRPCRREEEEGDAGAA
jgi:hypothetical protein